MTSTYRIEMEISSINFEHWKLKMEDMLVDRDIWATISEFKPIVMSQKFGTKWIEKLLDSLDSVLLIQYCEICMK